MVTVARWNGPGECPSTENKSKKRTSNYYVEPTTNPKETVDIEVKDNLWISWVTIGPTYLGMRSHATTPGGQPLDS